LVERGYERECETSLRPIDPTPAPNRSGARFAAFIADSDWATCSAAKICAT